MKVNVGNTTVILDEELHGRFNWATQDFDGDVNLWVEKPIYEEDHYNMWNHDKCHHKDDGDFNWEKNWLDLEKVITHSNPDWRNSCVRISWLVEKLDAVLKC